MRKKEDMGYGVIGLFALVSFALIILMAPYEPITTNAVADITAYATAGEFLSQNLVLVIVGLLLVGFAIGGIVFLIRQHRHRQRILTGIPHEKREMVEAYIKSTVSQGFSKDQIKKALTSSGWQESQADALLHEF